MKGKKREREIRNQELVSSILYTGRRRERRIFLGERSGISTPLYREERSGGWLLGNLSGIRNQYLVSQLVRRDRGGFFRRLPFLGGDLVLPVREMKKGDFNWFRQES